MDRKKKGVSPVIATILLIAIVVVLALIIFLWARGFVKESVQKRGENADYVCEDINLDVKYLKDTQEIQIINVGNIPIYRFEVKGKEGGSVKTLSVPEKNLAVGNSIEFEVEDYDEIEVFPVILGETETSKKMYTCKKSFIAK